jgi:hypothetical protein
MFSDTKRFIVVALLALTPCLSLTAKGQSKRRPPPHHGHESGHHFRGPGLGAGAQDLGAGSVSISQPNPADEMDAWSRWYQTEQTVKLMYEQIKRERLITKQLIEDYERRVRENTPSPEQERQLQKMAALQRSLDPPDYEIYSAQALNVLLEDLKPFQASTGKGLQLPLPQDMLGHFNVISVGDRSGNIGLLKKQGHLSWPLVLQAAEYQEPREALAALAPQAIDQAVHGGVQLETLQNMEDALGKLNSRLADNIKKLPAPRHIEAKHYLGELKEAFKLLEKPHAGNYFNGKFSARGKTVAELIGHMSRQGLKFAPSAAGDEAAYEFLHHYLVVYDVAAHQSLSHQD